jgi:hypothetical protein
MSAVVALGAMEAVGDISSCHSPKRDSVSGDPMRMAAQQLAPWLGDRHGRALLRALSLRCGGMDGGDVMGGASDGAPDGGVGDERLVEGCASPWCAGSAWTKRALRFRHTEALAAHHLGG